MTPFFFVVGVMRSGSSAAAAMLQAMGVDIGQTRPTKPYDCYECVPLVKLTLAHKPEPLDLDALAKYVADRRKENPGVVLAAKQPQLCRLGTMHGNWEGDTIGFLKDNEIRVIHTYRPLDEVVESDLRHYKRPRVKHLARLHDGAVQLERWCRLAGVPVMRVDFRDAQSNPFVTASRLARFVGMYGDDCGLKGARVVKDYRSKENS